MTASMPARQQAGGDSAAKAWARALELTASIARQPDRVLPTVIEERALQLGSAPVLVSDRESLTYTELVARSNQYARWALDQGLAKGEVVCLMMTNRPEYLAIWLGITKIGGVVALLNTNLTGASLAHCIATVAPKHIIVEAELAGALATALPELQAQPPIWIHGEGDSQYRRIDRDIERLSPDSLNNEERRQVSVADRALHIYTSGTTGLPKAANVSHARLMQWSGWFAGMLDVRHSDRIYDCLPMYHSVGGVLAPGAMLASGGSVFIRETFSASRFWGEVVRWDCTIFQYIGELCRYLLHAGPSPDETAHRIRIACGNGLRPDVWEQFQSRFRIPKIVEFYAATEGGLSLFNVEGKPGSIGRVTPYLAHRFAPALIRSDGTRCGTEEIGEAIVRISDDAANAGSRFEGYTNPAATELKILRDVFEPGDRWARTGDLMRRDEHGFFYFVDRVGDTFRWKGENVATCEVSETICEFPGVRQANVYGVAIPGADGRAGMAALVAEPEIDLAALRAHLIERLPHYARPLFLRIRNAMELTGTFKYTKSELVRQAYDPASTSDLLYFNDSERQAFVRLDDALFARIQSGEIRL